MRGDTSSGRSPRQSSSGGASWVVAIVLSMSLSTIRECDNIDNQILSICGSEFRLQSTTGYLHMEASWSTIVREEGKERQQQGLVVEAQPRILGLANYVANMLPTCRRHVSMLPNLGRLCVLLGNRRKTRMPNLYQLQPTSTNQPKRTGP